MVMNMATISLKLLRYDDDASSRLHQRKSFKDNCRRTVFLPVLASHQRDEL